MKVFKPQNDMIIMSKLEERIKLWNPWIIGKEFDVENFIYRNTVEQIKKYLNDKEIKIINGPRRAGKTTVMYLLINELLKKGKDVLYIDLEDVYISRFTLEEIIKEYIKITGNTSPYIFFDEIQRRDNWYRELRTIYDREELRIVISGSTSSLLKGKSTSPLAGRAIEFTVFPLNFEEMLGKDKNSPYISYALKDSIIEHYLNFGSYPAVFLEKREEKKVMLLLSYLNSIVVNDVGERIKEEISVVEDYVIHLLNSTASLTSVNSLRKALKISYERSERIYSSLIDSFSFIESEFFSYSVKVRKAMHRKIYPIDNGLITAVFPMRDKGKRLEVLVALELIKRGYKIYYYRGKRECDIIAVKGGKKYPIQVTWKNVDKREEEGLREAEKKTGNEGMLITRENIIEFLDSLRKGKLSV